MPDSFEALEGTIKATYERLVKEGALVPQPDTPAPSVPLDLEAAKKAGKVHPAGFPAPGSSRRRPVTIRYLFSTPAHRSCRRQLVPVMQVRVPTNIVSSICDDRGEEPTYNGVDMSTLIEGGGRHAQ